MRWCALVCVTGLLVSCGTTGGVVPAEVTVTAELTQYRRDEALHQVQVKVTNAGDAATVVDRVSFSVPGFTGAGESAPGASLEPGRRVDLPVVYGAAHCDGAQPVAVQTPPSARLWLDGRSDPVEVPVADPGGLAPRLAAEECARRAVTDAVTLAFAGTWTELGGGAVAGVLRVGAVDVPARLDGIDGTTLFGITAAALPIELGDPVDLPVTVRPQRCDPHAVADSSRGYAFRVGVSLGDAEPVLVTVDVDPAERGELDAALREHCGL